MIYVAHVFQFNLNLKTTSYIQQASVCRPDMDHKFDFVVLDLSLQFWF